MLPWPCSMLWRMRNQQTIIDRQGWVLTVLYVPESEKRFERHQTKPSSDRFLTDNYQTRRQTLRCCCFRHSLKQFVKAHTYLHLYLWSNCNWNCVAVTLDENAGPTSASLVRPAPTAQPCHTASLRNKGFESDLKATSQDQSSILWLLWINLLNGTSEFGPFQGCLETVNLCQLHQLWDRGSRISWQGDKKHAKSTNIPAWTATLWKRPESEQRVSKSAPTLTHIAAAAAAHVPPNMKPTNKPC